MSDPLNEKPVPVKPTPEEKKKVIEKKEDNLDEALDESFPASDPVAINITPPIVEKIPEPDHKK